VTYTEEEEEQDDTQRHAEQPQENQHHEGLSFSQVLEAEVGARTSGRRSRVR
jgi:hypothetical protein